MWLLQTNIQHRVITTRTSVAVPKAGSLIGGTFLLVSPRRGAVAAHQCLLGAAEPLRVVIKVEMTRRHLACGSLENLLCAACFVR